MTTLLALALLSPRYFTGSVYSDYYVGRKTANGEVFSQSKMTCASNDYPLGTKLLVTHPNGNTVTVKVNDRMHKRFTGKRIDFARLPWQTLEKKPDGLHLRLKVEVMK